MSGSWILIGEAEADQRIAADLVDRVLIEKVEWSDVDGIQWQRKWIGSGVLPEGIRRLTWQNLSVFARHFGIRPQGFFGEKPGEQDARQARIAIAVAKRLCQDVSAVVLIRDADKNARQRGLGLQQVQTVTTDLPVVIGLANPERESWVIAGFDPVDNAEKESLAKERQRLGFDPRTHSHRLTATNNNQAIKSPKRVLIALTSGDGERERICWRETDLEVLRSRGRDNGLKEFLHEVETMLVPLITGQA